MAISSTELSKYRQRLSLQLKEIERLAFYSAYADPLVQGTPGEVFRTCGQKTCQCAHAPTKRHGPYLVLQIYQEKKQRQIALRKEQKALWEKAKKYQKQMKHYLALKKACDVLTEEVRKVLNKRVEKNLPWNRKK